MPSCVLAYSGGLDTSVILGWLMEEGYDVHAVYVDLGQPCEDRDAILQKARNIGPNRLELSTLRRSFAATSPFLCSSGRRNTRHVPVGHVDRPAADLEGLPASCPRGGRGAYAHGATGKGNDQCRFQLAAESLRPDIKMIAPWRIEKFRQRFPGRTI